MTSEPAYLGGISLDSARISPRWDEDFPYEHAQVGQQGKVGRVFFNACVYVLLWIFFSNLGYDKNYNDYY